VTSAEGNASLLKKTVDEIGTDRNGVAFLARGTRRLLVCLERADNLGGLTQGWNKGRT
jgi:hypothetical protein